MGNVFSGSEIVEMGIQIEKNGRDFYSCLAEKIHDKKIQDIFKYLSEQEEKHIVMFQKILADVEKYEPPESYPGEYFAYMRSLAGEYIFTKANTGPQAAESINNTDDAVDKAIGFEKDSIVFYEGIKKIVPSAGQDTVGKLLEQEQSHLQQLLALRRTSFTHGQP